MTQKKSAKQLQKYQSLFDQQVKQAAAEVAKIQTILSTIEAERQKVVDWQNQYLDTVENAKAMTGHDIQSMQFFVDKLQHATKSMQPLEDKTRIDLTKALEKWQQAQQKLKYFERKQEQLNLEKQHLEKKAAQQLLDTYVQNREIT